MQEILDKLVDSRIHNLLEIININYPDKFKKEQIEKEFNHIKKHINWQTYLKRDNKKIRIAQSQSVKPVQPVHPIQFIKIKQKQIPKINPNQCSGRIWSNYIFNKTNNIKLDDIDNKFKVDDFNDLDIKDFISKYNIGLRCRNNKTQTSKYCKLHSKHLIHGDYLTSPDKELCYHFIKDGKYI